MKKIDRLGWAAGISVKAFGLRIGIRVNRADALPAIRSLLPPCSRLTRRQEVDLLYSLIVGGEGQRPQIRRFHLLYSGAARVIRTLELSELYEGLEQHLELTVAELARRV